MLGFDKELAPTIKKTISREFVFEQMALSYNHVDNNQYNNTFLKAGPGTRYNNWCEISYTTS